MKKLALLGAASLGALASGEKISNGLGDFLTTITSREFRSLGGDVWGCVDKHLPSSSTLRTDSDGRQNGEPPASFIIRKVSGGGGVGELMLCLLEHGSVDPGFMRFNSADLAHAMLTTSGESEEDPRSLLHSVLPMATDTLQYTRSGAPLVVPARTFTTTGSNNGMRVPSSPGGGGNGNGAPFPTTFCTAPHANMSTRPEAVDPLLDWQRTMSGSSDASNLLHHALAHEKTPLRHRDVQNLLFEDTASTEYDVTSHLYRRLGKALAFALHESDPSLSVKLLKATRRLTEAPPVDYPLLPKMGGHLPGKVMRLEDKQVLDDVMSGLLADEILAHSRRMHSSTTTTTSTFEPSGSSMMPSQQVVVPHLSQLLSAQDKVGRTPLHVAAVTDNAYGIRVMRRHIVDSLTSANASDVTWRNVTAAAAFLFDITGHTARTLAVAQGNNAAAAALASLEEEVLKLHPLGANMPVNQHKTSPPPHTVSPLPLPTSQAEACPNGGWVEPKFVGSKARAAISSYRQYAPNECEADVVDFTDCTMEDEKAGKCGMTPQQFYEHYFVPGKPVLLRGYAKRYPAYKRWTPEYFLARHGDNIEVRTSEIPYAQQWGVKGNSMPMGTYIQAMLTCTPEAAKTGLRAGQANAETCGLPSPMIDVPPELCAAFTQDDSRFVRGVDGDAPLPSSRLYIFHSVTAQTAARDPAVAELYNDIGAQRLPFVVNYSMPLWSARGRPPHSISAMSIDSNGRAMADANGMPQAPQHPQAHTSVGTGSGVLHPEHTESEATKCATDLIHWGGEVIQLFIGGPGSGAPIHYHQDAINTLLHGTKHWYLAPPSANSASGAAEFGTVAIADYVNRVLPQLKPEERPIQCTQRAGDVMYVPYAYGHGCFNTETSIGWATEVDTDMGRYSRL